MDKAILVIDMPECCKECMCYVLGAKNNFCEITKFAILNNSVRPDWCPLMPVPEKLEVWYDDDDSDWGKGYNSCLSQIVGD